MTETNIRTLANAFCFSAVAYAVYSVFAFLR